MAGNYCKFIRLYFLSLHPVCVHVECERAHVALLSCAYIYCRESCLLSHIRNYLRLSLSLSGRGTRNCDIPQRAGPNYSQPVICDCSLLPWIWTLLYNAISCRRDFHFGLVSRAFTFRSSSTRNSTLARYNVAKFKLFGACSSNRADQASSDCLLKDCFISDLAGNSTGPSLYVCGAMCARGNTKLNDKEKQRCV